MNVNKLSFSTGFFFVYFHEVEIASKSRYYILIYEDRYCCGLKSCVHTEYNKKETPAFIYFSRYNFTIICSDCALRTSSGQLGTESMLFSLLF